VSGVVMLAVDSPGTWRVFRALDRAVGVDHVVIEREIGRGTLLKARARRLGPRTAAGQVAILAAAGLDDATPAPAERVTRVPSANHPRAIEALRALEARVVVVGGTRIISREVLEAVPATFLNMHAGITPRYRGVHGGYWALACGDPDHCGVTVHVVDPGVDTGDVVAQALIEPTARDNFATYPLLQLVAGLPLFADAVRAALEGRLEQHPAGGPSRQWYHPTVWGYLLTRRRRGVR
jgi:folate-dependent phosphoribosylglycinamide formyltransferase PurN